MRLTYLFDPLCGWCYGAAPALERLRQLDGTTVELAPSGLFAGEGARAMDASFAVYAWQNDQRIARLTGQKFTDAYRMNILEHAEGMFDSAPATLGIIAAGLAEPAREIEAMKALQNGRYVDGLDNSELSVVSDILNAAGFSQAGRRVRAPDEPLLSAYRQRVSSARSEMQTFGVNGVPALIVEDEHGRRLLSGNALFGDFGVLAAQLRAA
ncbi:DsbA family protein [Rhizobium lusitanum]|uniref:DsbA family protein n=1 Tax=Rhizobium lusitanum TaxID=293958 RepID=UPI001571C2A7|nr:DsbA family protein [Rhizobium lusitanum]NTJ11551.1 DsbA family protein [Rhizobium lusitanum]